MRVLDGEAEIMRFTPMRIPQTPEQTEARLKALVARGPGEEPFGVWAAERSDGIFLGWFMLRKTDLEFPELGFMLVRSAWGKGLATEISAALVEHAFRELKVSGLMARVDADNPASLRVLEKLGFRFIESKCELDPVLGREVETRIFVKKTRGHFKTPLNA